jgi:hypothetical protein
LIISRPQNRILKKSDEVVEYNTKKGLWILLLVTPDYLLVLEDEEEILLKTETMSTNYEQNSEYQVKSGSFRPFHT